MAVFQAVISLTPSDGALISRIWEKSLLPAFPVLLKRKVESAQHDGGH